MVVFSLLVILYLPTFLFDLYANCDKQFQYKKYDNYNVCRFSRESDGSCNYRKFDSHDNEPCLIGRKAGLTRIDGVKVGIPRC